MADSEQNPKHLSDANGHFEELKKMAYLYHAVGNYSKADEIMNAVRSMEEELKRTEDRQRRDVA